MHESLSSRVYHFLEAFPHPQRAELSRILAAKTSLSTSGFPYISRSSFRMFLQEIPHLFVQANELLVWLNKVETAISQANEFQVKETNSLKRCIAVLRNIIQSSAICAPPDLWILRHILSNHAEIGLINHLQDGVFFDQRELADRFRLDLKPLRWDLAFLHCRGYLRMRGTRYALGQHFQAADVYLHARTLPEEFIQDMVDPLARVFAHAATDDEIALVRRFYSYEEPQPISKSWYADSFQVEVGYRLVPTVLAIHWLKIRGHFNENTNFVETLPEEAVRLLKHAGVFADGVMTPLGIRVFQRGPGPFGIIHAYVPYMRELGNKLRGKATHIHVQRAKNIAASQTANSKTFAMANDAIDRFCKEQNFSYTVFVEHALGQGEATRQRLQRNGEEKIQYFGADLEDAAINAAMEQQRSGVLPQNMKFIRNADIANPEPVIEAIQNSNFDTNGAVMVVGNGFHEIRSQTNERIVSVFKAYCEAGFLLIFTEESALGDIDLLNTAWNTYHSGFRYVHELSGQGLRPAAGADRDGRYSWKICASLGGYAVLPKYSIHTRTIYPFPKKGGYNPPISMTYFCVPHTLARTLGFYPVSWTQTLK